jgi:hypothetical protein
MVSGVGGIPHCNVSLWNASFQECNSTGLTNPEASLDEPSNDILTPEEAAHNDSHRKDVWDAQTGFHGGVFDLERPI